MKKKESFEEDIVSTQHVNMDKLRKEDEEKKKIVSSFQAKKSPAHRARGLVQVQGLL